VCPARPRICAPASRCRLRYARSRASRHDRWNENANLLLVPLLGIATLPVVAMPDIPFRPGDKVPRVDAFAGERPDVWIDDLHTDEARAWSTARRWPTELITIEPDVGLTREAVERALAWAAALT
jgi:hypothetical protein